MLDTLKPEIRVGHLCCGSGFGAKGFRDANVRLGPIKATFRNIGGIDVDPAAIRDFDRFAGCKGTVMDLMSLDQYRAFHGKEPPVGWREAMPADVHQAMGWERPHIWFISAPCKGFSGLLSEKASASQKYQALNQLTLRSVWLALEAYKDDPVELILFENVPRIATRGRWLLDQIQALLSAYGYAFAETTHDCGEIGGLSQSRKRFLLVARHREKVPPYLYEPRKLGLRTVGELLDKLPVPGAGLGGTMHRLPALQWRTWVRLAFVEAGSDWRSLSKLNVKDGYLADYVITPEMRGGVLGVYSWDDTSGTVAGRNGPTNGAFSVADPRAPDGALSYAQYGVRSWGQSSGAVINVKSPGQGAFAVADPRHSGPAKHSNEYRIVPWEGEGRAVTSAHGTGQCVADPRPSAFGSCRASYNSQGHYGVKSWNQTSGAVPAFAKHDRGAWAVADPRSVDLATEEAMGLPDAADRLVCRITSLDGTWHRPFTTLELAALQSLFEPEEWASFEMDGASDSAWRERIGNAVPPAAARSVAEVMGRTLLLAWTGETFVLSADPIWVQPVTVALAVETPSAQA